jgi:serine phosphatase RsbU (regulator of sigma subunit)
VVLYAAVFVVLLFEIVGRRNEDGSPVSPGAVLLVVVTAALVVVLARTRRQLGVQGSRGESMLVDLRDRLRAQGELPPLPPAWHAEVALRSSHGASFSGDFLVATKSPDGRTLEVVLVDVSGKGVDAGTRALMLSGAFGGLLGAMPSEDFLPAANQYLIRQKWEEGFATAAHLVLDLETGEFLVATAGHPPAAQFLAGSGRWELTGGIEGSLLGVIGDATYKGTTGRLERGDAMLLYTDGIIETPGRDLSVGIDRLLGEAERLVTRGFRHGARRLMNSVAVNEGDDRALVLIWRS